MSIIHLFWYKKNIAVKIKIKCYIMSIIQFIIQ